MKLPDPSALPINPPNIRAALNRVPRVALPLAILAALAAIAAFIADDYGSDLGERDHHQIAVVNLQYILGEADSLPLNPQHDADQYFGVAFEVPALLAARALRLTDIRDIFLARRILTHLLFLCAALACYALVYRLFNSAPIAFIAMLLFILHPRLYAHTFFNSQDSSFLSAFMIALYLAHRAFSKNTIGAFLALGACVGLATNIRTAGVMLVPAVLGMIMLHPLFPLSAPRRDAARNSPDARKRALTAALTSAAFVAAFAAALYIASPYLRLETGVNAADSALSNFIDAVKTHSQYPYSPTQIFQGVPTSSADLPWNYIPTWIGITTPPITLLLGAIGAAAILWRACASPVAALRDPRLRFGLLCAACFAVPIIVIAALGLRVHSDWRHLYFLYAPFCVIAAFGVREALRAHELRLPARIQSLFRRARPPRVASQASPPPWSRPSLYTRVTVRAALAAGLAAAAIAMLQLHPYQHIYFNFFVDRDTPEYLRAQFPMDYSGTATAEGLRYLLARDPSDAIIVNRGSMMLPKNDRDRIITATRNYPVDYEIAVERQVDRFRASGRRELYAVKIYNNTILAVYEGTDAPSPASLEQDIARFRQEYAALTAREPSARAFYDIYLNPDENTIAYAKSPCSRADFQQRFFLHIHPADPDVLPENRKRFGFQNSDFSPQRLREAVREGACLNIIDLPDYDIAKIKTGQYTRFVKAWTATLDLAAPK